MHWREPRFHTRGDDGGNEIEVFETTAGQVSNALKRLGVPKERKVTVMIEPDD